MNLIFANNFSNYMRQYASCRAPRAPFGFPKMPYIGGGVYRKGPINLKMRWQIPVMEILYMILKVCCGSVTAHRLHKQTVKTKPAPQAYICWWNAPSMRCCNYLRRANFYVLNKQTSCEICFTLLPKHAASFIHQLHFEFVQAPSQSLEQLSFVGFCPNGWNNCSCWCASQIFIPANSCS